jgi:cytosine deaminase
MANLHANVTQLSRPAQLADCFDMLTTRSAKLLNLGDYGVRIGNPADLAVIDAETREQAVAELREPLAVWKRGRRTVTRPRPELHRPG